jgi:cbb3-type cytochrome oxidase subunit 3
MKPVTPERLRDWFWTIVFALAFILGWWHDLAEGLL